MDTAKIRTTLEACLEHLGPEETLPDLSPAMWIAGAFGGTSVVSNALAADDRNKLRRMLWESWKELRETDMGQQDGLHTCPAKNCEVQIGDNLLMCYEHWFTVPVEVRKTINKEWQANRGSSAAYKEARAAALTHVNTVITKAKEK